MLNLLTVIACSIATRHGSVHPVQFACALKGGLLSIVTQELLLALQPSPPGLDHGIATWHTSDCWSLPWDRDLSAQSVKSSRGSKGGTKLRWDEHLAPLHDKDHINKWNRMHLTNPHGVRSSIPHRKQKEQILKSANHTRLRKRRHHQQWVVRHWRQPHTDQWRRRPDEPALLRERRKLGGS